MNCVTLEWDREREDGGKRMEGFMPVFIEPQSNEVHGLPLTNGPDGIKHRRADILQ